MSDDKSGTGSPPTGRVVSVVELLGRRDKPCTAAEVADSLKLSRSTVAAVLSTLDGRGWVRRLPDRTYQLGPRLVSIAESARNPLAGAPAGIDDALDLLSGQVGCGAALSLVTRTELTFVAVTEGKGRLPAGITTGTSLPLRAPAGAAVLAFADEQVQRSWLATAGADQRGELSALLDRIRATGVGVWGIDAADPSTLDVLSEVVELLSQDPGRRGLRARVLALLANISGRPYGADELVDDTPLPLSYLVAPVFGSDGRAAWELQIGPLASAVARTARESYIEQLTRTARELDMRTGADS